MKPQLIISFPIYHKMFFVVHSNEHTNYFTENTILPGFRHCRIIALLFYKTSSLVLKTTVPLSLTGTAPAHLNPFAASAAPPRLKWYPQEFLFVLLCDILEDAIPFHIAFSLGTFQPIKKLLPAIRQKFFLFFKRISALPHRKYGAIHAPYGCWASPGIPHTASGSTDFHGICESSYPNLRYTVP